MYEKTCKIIDHAYMGFREASNKSILDEYHRTSLLLTLKWPAGASEA